MRVLAIDTALEACSAAVLDTERAAVVRARIAAMERGHAEALMPLIARVMDRAELDFPPLDRIAVTTGPGSFTGLRVGIAAARGIALAAGKPAVGLSTLAAFAAPFIAADDTLPVVLGDRCAPRPRLPAGVRPRRPHPRGAAARIVARGAARVGDRRAASHRHRGGDAGRGLAGRRARRRAWSITRRAPDIDWVARLGAAALDTGAPPKPLYLRAPDAQPQNAAQLARR